MNRRQKDLCQSCVNVSVHLSVVRQGTTHHHKHTITQTLIRDAFVVIVSRMYLKPKHTHLLSILFTIAGPDPPSSYDPYVLLYGADVSFFYNIFGLSCFSTYIDDEYSGV